MSLLAPPTGHYNVHPAYINRLKWLMGLQVGLWILFGLSAIAWVAIMSSLSNPARPLTLDDTLLAVLMSLAPVGFAVLAYIVDYKERRPLIRTVYRITFRQILERTLALTIMQGASTSIYTWEHSQSLWFSETSLALQLGTSREVMTAASMLDYTHIRPGEPYLPVLAAHHAITPWERFTASLNGFVHRVHHFSRRKVTI